uniref:Caspase-1 n=1 Tax=Anoplophora glabripennis TaxID=217634 RepID=V5G4Y4_ANOGL
MFKKNQKKEEKKSVSGKIGDTTTTSQVKYERRLSENTVEHRSVTYTSTAYSSVRVTNKDFGKSTVTNSGSLFGNNSNILKPLGDRTHAIDAPPFSTARLTSANEGGYKSIFSRKLAPYSTDARPFTFQQPPQRTLPIQPSPSAQVLPRYSSYLPESRTTLNTAPSTHSLPTSNEPNIQEDPRIPTYNTKGKNRGNVLIINNIKFLQEKQERKGAELDEKNLRTMFKDMGFNVETHKDLKKAAMVTKISKFSGDSSLKKADISVLIMMSHGSNVDESGKVIQGGFTQIYGIDDGGLAIDDILDKFSGEKCPAMAGKPKIFIFQCCRGERQEHNLHNDGVPMTRNVVKKHGDMLVAFSTLPGFFSIRDTQQGSWYIQSICEVFKKYGKEMDVETLLKIVDEQLSKKHPKYQQTSTYECRGFKRCFLNPK